VSFHKSTFKGRPPTSFFIYPNYVNCVQEFDKGKVKSYDRRGELEGLHLSFYISDRTHIYNAVVNTMKCAGFDQLEKNYGFNLIWTGYTQIEDILPLNRYQKINHFPNSVHLGRKDLFWKNILRMKLKFPTHFNITPHAWVLPASYAEFEHVKSSPLMQSKMFIIKPSASSCGRGIRVV